LLDFVKGKAPATRKVRRAYEDAGKHLAFLEKWVQISERATPELPPEIRTQISAKLQKVHERLSVELEIVHIAVHARNVAKTEPTQSLWRLLLIYKPRRAVAWLPPVFFYLIAVVGCIAALVLISVRDFSGVSWLTLPDHVFYLCILATLPGSRVRPS
jgi:hypothetical protein